MEAKDVAHAELEALRAELLARSQAQVPLITAALTIVAAVGGFALAKKEGRVEMLLVLPLVLSGLGLLIVEGVQGNRRIAKYIRDHQWGRLPENAGPPEAQSWEHYVAEFRRTNTDRLSAFVFSSVTPIVLIFVVPSIASLAVTFVVGNLGALWALWLAGLASILAFGVLAMGLRRH
jgi:hypothetical protein